jgi:aspartyl-tRNA synthetase
MIQICDVTGLVSDEFKRMITPLSNPIIEAWRLNLHHTDRLENGNLREWIGQFMESLPKEFMKNPDGAPVILGDSPDLPLRGFASLGPEGIKPLLPHLDLNSCSNLLRSFRESSRLPPISAGVEPSTPYIVVFQARKPHDPSMAWRGASTRIGELRKRLFDASFASRLNNFPSPGNLQWTWVTRFPLFKPDDSATGGDPGQGGTAGIASVHHPFTAPFNYESSLMLDTNPLGALSDSFDLVVNGVEVGGGSRRIHTSMMQEAILRRVLKMSDEGVERFRPLLNTLRYAPPHVGFAFGFDRLAAMMSGTTSIRDVIAFPKTMKGEDAWAKSPARLTEEQLATYHLKVKE